MEDQNEQATASESQTNSTQPVSDLANHVVVIGGDRTAQQEFDALVARKDALWAQIKGNVLYDLTTEWKEIQSLDERMLAIWNSGAVSRKEDK